MTMDSLDTGSVLRFLDAGDAVLIEQPIVDQGNGSIFGTVDLLTFVDVVDGDFTAAGVIAFAVFLDSRGAEQARFSCVLSDDPSADTSFHISGSSLVVGIGMASRTGRVFVSGLPSHARIAGTGIVT